MKKYSSKKLGMIAVVVLASGLATQAQVTIFTQGLSTDSTPKLQGNGGDISVASVTINSPTVFNMNGNWTTTGAGYGFVQAAWQDKAVAANVGNSDTTPSDYILSFDALATSGNQNSAWSGVGGLNVQIQVWANNYFAGTETILQAGGESGNGYQDLTVSGSGAGTHYSWNLGTDPAILAPFGGGSIVPNGLTYQVVFQIDEGSYGPVGQTIGMQISNLTLTQVPEPTTLALAGLGAAALLAFRRRNA